MAEETHRPGQNRPKPAILLAVAAALLLGGGAQAAGRVTPEQERFFETSVRPVLVNHCQKCHGPDKQMGGLRLDTAAGFLKGGTRGPSLKAEDPDHTVFLRAIRHEDAALKMPPGQKLGQQQIADLTRWIKMGAPWPARANSVSPQHWGAGGASSHWAFKPVRRPAVPSVKNRAWVKTPVDAFILAKLEASGLKPAAPADKRTLIRRASFDLTGLPSTPQEVDAFLADKSPTAFSKVVDRLLASPAYGERWGRHWLDVARYADSNGLDENVHYGNAWRYRDWVINALNQDKPYDRFLVEQIAGDLLPAPDVPTRNSRLIATGFLAIGPKFISEVDSQKVQMDMVDEQVDTVGRSIMGITLGCARCHDHKFDPISTKDYYALAGIFKSTKTLEVWKKPRMWFEHSLATEADLARKAAWEKQVADQKQAIAALTAQETERLKSGLAAGATLPKNPEPQFSEQAKADLKRLRVELAAVEKDPPAMPAAMGVTEGEVQDIPVHIRGDFLQLGEMVPRRFPVILAGQAQPRFDKQHSGRLQLAQWLASPEHPLTSRVMANRLWRWHFGQGIVRTPDNFGLLGEKPTHPELLDWLATEFTKNGWSIKQMHRLIMNSAVYQQSSTPIPHSAHTGARMGAFRTPHSKDPENRLFSHFSLRRLEAEEIRDSILAVSGSLDRTMGGSILPLKNREYVFDHTSKDNTRYDSKRRSVYVPVVRNNLYDVFSLFDFGDAQLIEGNRPTTTVAPQALFMLNSDMVLDSAAALADQLLQRSELDTDGKVRLLYQKAYSRLPSAKETTRARALLTRFQQAASEPDPEKRSRQAWTWLTHTTLAANEFIFVR